MGVASSRVNENPQDIKVESTTRNNTARVRFPQLPNLVLLSITEYLEAAEFTEFSTLSKEMQGTCTDIQSRVWQNICSREFGCETFEPLTSRNWKHAYLQYKWHVVRTEISHFEEVLPLAEAVARLRQLGGEQSGDVVGILCDIGTVKDPRVANVLSLRRQSAMMTVVVRNPAAIDYFRNTTQFFGPVSFFPIDYQHDPGAPTPDQLPTVTFPGFVGYAYALIKLRPEQEYLRLPVLFAIFGDMMVFRTSEDIKNYRAAIARSQGQAEEKNERTDGDGEDEYDEAVHIPERRDSQRLWCVAMDKGFAQPDGYPSLTASTAGACFSVGEFRGNSLRKRGAKSHLNYLRRQHMLLEAALEAQIQ